MVLIRGGSLIRSRTKPKKTRLSGRKTSILRPFTRGCIGHITESGLSPYIELLRTTSMEAAPMFREIDLVHIDANHSEWSSIQDVVLWIPKVRSGGIVIMGDINFETVAHARRLALKECDIIKEIFREEGTSFGLYRKR
ncbi:MAG: class I SAM-dependent methyltransferase [Pedosphaera sp.]|nr:class I SAM-dependent methyltransferase [Pedosphaera sp.]